VAIPADRNVVQKEVEKKLKYKSLCIEIQQMWNLKCMIVPVIIGACTRKTFNRFTTKDILGTSHTIRKVLQCEA